MGTRAQNPALELALPRAVDKAFSPVPVAAQEEVILLFDEFRARLFRYVLSLGLSVHDGEDVIQEVFLSLFRHLKIGRSRENLRGWLFQVSHNLALKQRYRRQKQHATVANEQTWPVERIDSAENPEEQLANSQRQERLLSAMRALPEQDRWCLSLRAEGLRYREIAQVVGISLGAVSNSLAKSMKRLMRVDEQ
jgi:RNA polymerase sigma-70 factor, ECF subfamily